ncbi:MAG: iron complex transport system substrate-binding protein [Planctomycetota bacterium]|jgi:iron complex transport system substrate-binding protein
MSAKLENPAADLRVVSLLPSATEIVCLLGGEANLVGISHECDFPAGVTQAPVLTSSKVDFSPSSLKIDQDVRALMGTALAVYDIDTQKLQEVKPDIIVTQDLCDVCAVSYEDVKRACNELLPNTRIVNLHPTRWSEVMDDVQKVAEAFGNPERGAYEVAQLEERRLKIKERAAALSSRPKVLTIEWIDPVMVGGTWMPELVDAAGGEALVTTTGDHAPTLSKEQLAALDPAPDAVLIKPCGFKLERTFSERAVLDQLFEGLDWPALRDGRVWIADGNAFFNRPGPRLVESIEILAACLHPEEFPEFVERHASSYVKY